MSARKKMIAWYHDAAFTSRLPLLYRPYGWYWRLFARKGSRDVRGGSFLLRMLRSISRALGAPTVVELRGDAGTLIRADFADERILEVIQEIRAERREIQILLETLSYGDTFIDVGANFGSYSLSAARAVGDAGRVIAVEPNATLAQWIRDSAELNRFNQVAVFNVACGAENGTSTLIIPRDDSGRAGLYPEFSGRWPGEHSHITVVTLDSIVRDVPISGRVFIKIDVEGSEIDVLMGAVETIAARRPHIMIELNPWSASAAGSSTRRVIETLTGCGYTSFATTESYPATIPPDSIPLSIQSNIVAIP